MKYFLGALILICAAGARAETLTQQVFDGLCQESPCPIKDINFDWSQELYDAASVWAFANTNFGPLNAATFMSDLNECNKESSAFYQHQVSDLTAPCIARAIQASREK